MKKTNKPLAALLAFAFMLTGCYSTSEVVSRKLPKNSEDRKINVAVVDFANLSGDSQNDPLISSIAGNLVSELQKTRSVRLIERQRLESVLSELKLGMSGLVDPKNAKEVGNQLGVDAMLFGNLSSVKHTSSKQTIFIMYREVKKTETTVDARLVNVETGEIIASSRVNSYVKQSKWVAFGFAKLGRNYDKNASVTACLELAARNLANDIASQLPR